MITSLSRYLQNYWNPVIESKQQQLSARWKNWSCNGRISNTAVSTIASTQMSFGVRLSCIHFSPTDIWSMGEKWIRDKWTPKDICVEAISTIQLKIDHSSRVENKLLFKPPHTLSTVKWLVPYHKTFLPLRLWSAFFHKITFQFGFLFQNPSFSRCPCFTITCFVLFINCLPKKW